MRFELQNLEGRKLFSAAMAASPYGQAVPTTFPIHAIGAAGSADITHTGTLLIQGTTQSDKIEVSSLNPASGKGQVVIIRSASNKKGNTVITSDTALIYVSRTTAGQTRVDAFLKSDVKRIHIEGGAGNDTLIVDPSLKKGVMLVGGAGNDSLVGGNFGDTLSGGAGNDVLKAAPEQATVEFISAGKLVSAKPQPVGGKLYIPDYQNKKNTTSAVTYNLLTTTERSDSADLLEGGAGDDTITAGQGPDTVSGGAGNDVLIAPGRTGQAKGISGSKPVDYDGLTVSSMEKLSSSAESVVVTNRVVTFPAYSNLTVVGVNNG